MFFLLGGVFCSCHMAAGEGHIRENIMPSKHASRSSRILLAFGAVAIINVGCSLIASILYASWFPAAETEPVPFPWGWLILLLTIVAAGFWMGRIALIGYFRVESRPRDARIAAKKKVLIWFLSNIRIETPGATESVEEFWPKGVTRSKNLDDDLRNLVLHKKLTGKFWPGEQPLRGIRHNLRSTEQEPGGLERLILICSRESIGQVRRFISILRGYDVARGLAIEVWLQHNGGSLRPIHSLKDTSLDNGWEFDAFDRIYECLLRLVRELERQGISESEIAIDLTAGSKPTSVAAAAATIGRRIVNQYVCTNPRDRKAEAWEYDVLEYDLLSFSQATE